MKLIQIILYVALLFVAPARAADVVFPPGSHVGLVPPVGVMASRIFPGFEDPDKKVAIIIAQLPVEAYAGLAASTDAEALRRQGMTLEQREPLMLALGNGFLLLVQQEFEGVKLHKWIAVTATADFTALVTFQVPDDARASYPDTAVRAALASITSRASVPIEEQFGLLPFKVGDLAGFRVGGFIGGRAIMLTDAPDQVIGPSADPQIMVAVTSGGPGEASERERFAAEAFRSISNLRDVSIVSAEPLRLNGLPAHEVIARAKQAATGIDITVVQWLRFNGGSYMHVIAVARTEAWTQAYARFRQVRDGVELR
jgi:hypothetical protein